MENPILFKPTTDGSKRPLARSRILSARFTETEYAALENFAWSKGTTLADWVRDVLLRSLEVSSQAQMEMHIFTELVGIQMLLMNTLEPLLRGDKIVPEQLAIQTFCWNWVMILPSSVVSEGFASTTIGSALISYSSTAACAAW